jgi:hypothetical protein
MESFEGRNSEASFRDRPNRFEVKGGENELKRTAVENTTYPNETPEATAESQLSLAEHLGFEKWEDVPAINKAEFYANDGMIPDNWVHAAEEAEKAGLEQKDVLEMTLKALENRRYVLAHAWLPKGRSSDTYDAFVVVDELYIRVDDELRSLQESTE